MGNNIIDRCCASDDRQIDRPLPQVAVKDLTGNRWSAAKHNISINSTINFSNPTKTPH